MLAMVGWVAHTRAAKLGVTRVSLPIWDQGCTAGKSVRTIVICLYCAGLRCRFVQDPAQRLTLPQVMAHPWVTAGGSLRPLRPSGGWPAAAVAAKRGLATAFDGACSTLGGAAEEAAAGAPAVAAARQQQLAEQAQSQQLQPLQVQEQMQAPQAAEDPEADDAEEADAEQEALLRASLEGLVTGDLQVHSFAAGETLMRRGQPGAVAGLLFLVS